jgi:hypothetical protein
MFGILQPERQSISYEKCHGTNLSFWVENKALSKALFYISESM